MSTESQGLDEGQEGESDLTSLSEYDCSSTDDAGSDCSCSTCSTCSLCDEEDEECGSSCYEDEYLEEEDGEGDQDETVRNGRIEGRRAMRYRNGELNSSDLPDPGTKKLVKEENHGFSKERLLSFGNHGNGKELNKHANGVCDKYIHLESKRAQKKHCHGNGTTITALPAHLAMEALSLQRNGYGRVNSELNERSRDIHETGHEKKRKKVQFIDSSSSSDDVMLTEQFSMCSDSSTSGLCPSLCSASGDSARHGTECWETHVDGAKLRSPKSATDINLEYARLRNVLKTIDPLKLHAILKHALKSKKSEMIEALATLLPKTKFTADTVHCVRCHKEFDPHYGRKRCALPHPEVNVFKVSQDSEGADFECSMCGAMFHLQGAWDYKLSTAAEQDCGPCFLGTHTPCLEEVEFGPRGAAQSCEDKGCIVFYV